MKFMEVAKDGGPESTVTGYFIIELKWLFTIVLLRFDGESRDAYHSHAFNCFSWVLSGHLEEVFYQDLGGPTAHRAGWKPFITRRTDLHQVKSHGQSWVLSFRGPWDSRWEEVVDGKRILLANGRKRIR